MNDRRIKDQPDPQAMGMSQGMLKLPREVYHADPCPEPSLSQTTINHLLRSPRHAWTHHPRLGGVASEESPRLSFGTVAHSILLEGDESKIVVVDAADWRTKVAQQARDAAWAEGKQPILTHDLLTVREMVEAAQSFIGSAEWFEITWSTAKPEVACVWREGETWCRSLLDKLDRDGDGNGYIFDYKTTTNAKPDVWGRNQLVPMGYDIQAAWYRRGYRATAEGREADFVFLVQEMFAPYACSWVAPSAAMLALADRKIEYALEVWRKCMKTGEWPAYSTAVHYADPLPWQEAAWLEKMGLEEMERDCEGKP